MAQIPHTWAELHIFGALGGTRTPNPLIRSQMLYPLSYERKRRGHSTGDAAPLPTSRSSQMCIDVQLRQEPATIISFDMHRDSCDVRIGIVGTDLAPLNPGVGALEKLCLGWAEELELMGFQISLFSVGSPYKPLIGNQEFHVFVDQNDLHAKLSSANLDAVIVNNRPSWNAAGINSRINIFHNYPDAWLVEPDDNLTLILSKSRNLAVSAALAEQVNRVYPTARASILYPFIERPFIEASNDAIPETLNDSHHKIRVLFPNRTLEKKGLRFLIAAIDTHLLDETSLTVVRNISPWTAETAEHRSLLDLARSRPYVTIKEKVLNTKELIELYRAHDVIVTPSVQPEGLGLIPLEAQATGVPVVASDLGGLTESVFPPNLTVPVGSTSELAKAIASATKISNAERESLASLIAGRFSRAQSARTLAAEIEALLHSDGLR